MLSQLILCSFRFLYFIDNGIFVIMKLTQHFLRVFEAWKFTFPYLINVSATKINIGLLYLVCKHTRELNESKRSSFTHKKVIHFGIQLLSYLIKLIRKLIRPKKNLPTELTNPWIIEFNTFSITSKYFIIKWFNPF